MTRRMKRKSTGMRKYSNLKWGNGKWANGGRGFSFKRVYKTSVNGVKKHPYVTASVSTLTLAGAAGLISALIMMKRH